MPTVVLDLDLQQLPAAITVPERYDRALTLIRLNGQPVGQALLPVVDGRVGGDNLRDELLYAADSAFWEQWLCNYLGSREERTTNSMPPVATVAVCTRDRPEDLRRCLEALMRLPNDGQELLVIDNCPLINRAHHLTEGQVRENRLGLNRACNQALRGCGTRSSPAVRHTIPSINGQETIDEQEKSESYCCFGSL